MDTHCPPFRLSDDEAISHSDRLSGAFGTTILDARPLDRGMGEAVGRRTVFRPGDHESFGRVADRVATGNVSLVDGTGAMEQAQLRNAIAVGALLTSGRHLQHGDAEQRERNLEVFTNCATAISSFAKFYLLLNGSGVGRAYDDALCAVDWGQAPTLLLHLSPDHPDFPREPRRPAPLRGRDAAPALGHWNRPVRRGRRGGGHGRVAPGRARRSGGGPR